MLENTNIKQFYPGPILNKTLEITNFLFRDPEQVKVQKTALDESGNAYDIDLAYGTDYEVQKVLPNDITIEEGNLTASTGQIILKDTVEVNQGEKLTAYRESALVQDVDYPRTGKFPAASHEGALDYLTMQNQEQQDQINRSLKVPITTQNFNGALPVPEPSKALKINSSGTGFELSEYDPDTALELTEEFASSAASSASSAASSASSAASSASSAASSASSAVSSATTASQAEDNAETWAEGTDTEVQVLGGEKSAKGWAQMAKPAAFEVLDIGIAPCGIDENENKRRYTNGGLILQSQFPVAAQKLKTRSGWGQSSKSIYNVAVMGTLQNDNGVLSGFSAGNYATISKTMPSVFSFEIFATFTLTGLNNHSKVYGQESGFNYSTPQLGVSVNNKFICDVSPDNVSWVTLSVTPEDGLTATVGQKYNEYISWDVESKTLTFKVKKAEDEEFTIVKTTSVNSVYFETPPTIGIDGTEVFAGSIDLNGCYININGSRWWTGAETIPTALFMPELVLTETEWQARLAASDKGQVAAFAIDDEAGTIRLPKIYNIQGCYELAKAGATIKAGLPNIEGTISSIPAQTTSLNTQYGTGAFSKTITGASAGVDSGGIGQLDTLPIFDASDSNAIYGNSETVQEEACQYPFFIQLATSAATEVTITNEIESNNLATLFDYKYTEAPLFNASWLRATGSYAPKTSYPTAYEALLVEYNSSVEVGDSVTLPSGGNYIKRGLSVKLSTDESMTESDFGINTTDETFKLPTKTKINPVSGGTIPVVGNGKALGLMNGNGTTYYTDFNSDAGYGLGLHSYTPAPPPVGTARKDTENVSNLVYGVTLEPELSGLEANIPTLDGIYLYYYVGKGIENMGLINAGRFAEQFANVDKALYYLPGDSYNLGDVNYCGALTSAQTLLFFTVPVYKSLKYINNIVCTALSVSARKPSGGYVISINWDALANATINISRRNEYFLDIRITKGSAYSETNNIPLSVQCAGSFIFS